MNAYHHTRLRLALIAIRIRANGAQDDMGPDIVRIVDDAIAGDREPSPRDSHQFDPVRVDGQGGFEVEVRTTNETPPAGRKNPK